MNKRWQFWTHPPCTPERQSLKSMKQGGAAKYSFVHYNRCLQFLSPMWSADEMVVSYRQWCVVEIAALTVSRHHHLPKCGMLCDTTVDNAGICRRWNCQSCFCSCQFHLLTCSQHDNTSACLWTKEIFVFVWSRSCYISGNLSSSLLRKCSILLACLWVNSRVASERYRAS